MPEGRGFQPTAWRGKSASHVFKPVVPRSDHGMHVNLHRGLNERYQRPDTRADPLCYGPTMRIIYRQRSPQRVFAGQAPVTSYPVQKVTRRLSCFDPVRGPPGSSMNPEGASPFFPYVVCSKPTYSATEVSAIVERLYARKKEEGRCPPRLQWHSKRQSYPAEMLEEVLQMYCSTEKLCETQPFRNAKRHRVKVMEDIAAAQKRYSESEIKESVRRLSEYNPNTWPPNSKGVIPPGSEPPVAVKYPSAPAPSQAFIDDLVDRLYNGKIDPDAYLQSQKRDRKDAKTRAKTAPVAKRRAPPGGNKTAPSKGETKDRSKVSPRDEQEVNQDAEENAHAQSSADEEFPEYIEDAAENTNKNNAVGDSSTNSETVQNSDSQSIHSEIEMENNDNGDDKKKTEENNESKHNEKPDEQKDIDGQTKDDVEQTEEIVEQTDTEKDKQKEQNDEQTEERKDERTDEHTEPEIDEDIDDDTDPVLRKMRENDVQENGSHEGMT